jgi:DNA recombination protein RmuC
MVTVDRPESIIVILLTVLTLSILVLVLILLRFMRSDRRETDQGIRVMTDLGNQVAMGISSMTRQVEVFGQVREKLGELSTVGAQVNELANTLKMTQKRGVWGEQMLAVLLDSLVPKNHGPHTFKDGQRVEQALLLPDGKLVGVDSKFTLDAFRRLQSAQSEQEQAEAEADFVRSLRDRIDETAKYIRPNEGTLDFALMFLPAESVYYEFVCNDRLCLRDRVTKSRRLLWDYSLERHVIPVSPNTMYAYLTVIVYGLRGMEMEEKAKEMLNYLLKLQHDFDRLRDASKTMGGHLNNARSKYEEVDRMLAGFADRLTLDSIPTDGESGP